MSVKLMIFDKDGVLFDTEPAKTKSYWLALRALADIDGLERIPVENAAPVLRFWYEDDYYFWHTKNLTGKSRREVINGIFNQFGKMIERVLAEHNAAVRETLDGGGKEVGKELTNAELSSSDQRIFSALRLKLYNEIPLPERARPIEATIAFMRTLLKAHIPIALITESKYDRTIKELGQLESVSIYLPSFRIIACKDGIFAAGQKAAEGGEKQEMYKRIMFLAACEPDQCLVVEDSDKGQAAALAAGLVCLMISFPAA